MRTPGPTLLVLAVLAGSTLPEPAHAQPAPTFGVAILGHGYRDAHSLAGGFGGELTGGIEWRGRTRIEIGGSFILYPEPQSPSLPPIGGGWGLETAGVFAEISRLLGERDSWARFLLAARAGYERFFVWDRDGFQTAARMGWEFRLGSETALAVTGLVGWTTFEDFNPNPGTRDLTGIRLGLNLGLRIHPGGRP